MWDGKGTAALAECCYSSATRSRYPSSHKSSSPSGRRSTRSGSRALTAPSSWVTRTIAPSYLAIALSISSRLAGSRLFVGSSRSSTLAPLVTSVASARRVFSPPDSTAAGLKTSSPEKRKLPRMDRTCVSSRSGATCWRFSSTVAPVSRVSCSCAK